jgi:hypothetical protein
LPKPARLRRASRRRSVSALNTVQEIESAIEKLPVGTHAALNQ